MNSYLIIYTLNAFMLLTCSPSKLPAGFEKFGSIGDMFYKDKAKKSHYHYRYVCCAVEISIKNYHTLQNISLS
jgi:hypothetical protein